MSARLAIIAVLIALALGIALALVTRGGLNGPSSPGVTDTGGPDEELAAFDAGRVTTLVVEREDEPPLTVRRSAAGAWSLTMEDAAAWSVVPENPINLLRALRTLTGQRPGETGSAADGIPPNAVRLALITDQNDRTDFAFDPAPVAGRVRAWANGRGPYLISDEIIIALTDPGPIGWRIPRVFPGLNEFTATRIALQTDEGQSIELRRLAGQWHLQEPVRAGANQQAVAELLRALASLQVGRFMPGTEALRRRAETEPAWRITAGLGRGQTAELNIWGALEPSGTILLAAVRDADTAPWTFLAMPAVGLAELRVQPTIYLAIHPTEQSRVDIAAISITSPATAQRLRLERDLDRWTIAANNEDPRPDTDNHANQLLNLLTQRPTQPSLFPAGAATPVPDAASAASLPSPKDFVLHAIIEIRSLDDGVLEVIRLGHSTSIAEDGTTRASLTALRGQLRWDFTEDRELPRAVRMVMPSEGLPGID